MLPLHANAALSSAVRILVETFAKYLFKKQGLEISHVLGPFFFSVSRHFGRRSQASIPRGRIRTMGTALTSGRVGGPVQAHA